MSDQQEAEYNYKQRFTLVRQAPPQSSSSWYCWPISPFIPLALYDTARLAGWLMVVGATGQFIIQSWSFSYSRSLYSDTACTLHDDQFNQLAAVWLRIVCGGWWYWCASGSAVDKHRANRNNGHTARWMRSDRIRNVWESGDTLQYDDDGPCSEFMALV